MYSAVKNYSKLGLAKNNWVKNSEIFDRINATFQDNNSTKQCGDGWVFEKKVMHRTTISDYSLVCNDSAKIAHTHSVYMAGFFVGSLLAGPIADYLGRKTGIVIFLIGSCTFSIALSFAPSFPLFLFFRFMLAIGGVGGWITTFVLMQELTSARYRSWIGGLFWLPYSIGYTCLSGFAYFIRDWRTLNLVLSVPLIGYFGMIWNRLCPESFRWLIAKGKIDRAYKTVYAAAKANGRHVPDTFSLDAVIENIKKEEAKLQSRKANFWDIFKYPVYISRMANLYFNWMVNSMVYYGLAYHVSSFAGNVFLNNSISGFVEIPGTLVTVPLLMWGRKRALVLSLGLAGVACLLISVPYPENLKPLSLFFFFVGRFAITTSFGVVYCITSDLSPTVARTTAQATSSMMARIGSIIAPYILVIPEAYEKGSDGYNRLKPLPPIIFGICGLVAAALTFLLPETRGENMPETIQDGLDNMSLFEKKIASRTKPFGAAGKNRVAEISSAGVNGTTQDDQQVYRNRGFDNDNSNL